jgi:hypothetical protein
MSATRSFVPFIQNPTRERGYGRRPVPLFDDASEALPRCIDDGRA